MKCSRQFIEKEDINQYFFFVTALNKCFQKLQHTNIPTYSSALINRSRLSRPFVLVVGALVLDLTVGTLVDFIEAGTLVDLIETLGALVDLIVGALVDLTVGALLDLTVGLLLDLTLELLVDFATDGA